MAKKKVPWPLVLDTEPWDYLVQLFDGFEPWDSKLRAAELVRDKDEDGEEYEYRRLRLTFDELDSLWESVSSAMDAIEREEDVELLDTVLGAIGGAMDVF